ncbi:MAG: DUF1667 domain-containing protein, partial [Spirochaetes bacterium]|nr:DUF1667 domain-containing protein [Spirochaetota bacterium]
GLIPECEIAKKADIPLLNQFSPEVNNKFETCVEGVFICGNSLHIHDLADNASFEGEKVAGYIVQYLNENSLFINDRKEHKPYREKNIEKRFNKTFFEELKGKRVCIICPKGCILDGVNYDCHRGKDFYEKEMKEKKRKLATTVYCEYKGIKLRIPVISKEEVNISEFKKLKAMLKDIKKIDDLTIEVKLNNEVIHFIATKV